MFLATFLATDTRFLAVLHGSPATTTHHRCSHQHRDALFALGAAVTGTAIIVIVVVIVLEGAVLRIGGLVTELIAELVIELVIELIAELIVGCARVCCQTRGMWHQTAFS